ncbi:GH25 family lysozyme [Fructilactobacillus lindneri]|uniref:LysM domain-containing protein n=1 Tax=Fructilactobacillus lindneri TaxID=53444 RepID=A0AB33BIL1_9LACO|nr:GH25 family lysozyme [Fructilactobacillus lindneri]ANZ59358.1 hypothetical protein AYR59_04725 [Fructilactobacillus lindneri]POH04609.1 hypothetical protein BGL33_06880 [Fructilactobacillus lindneri]
MEVKKIIKNTALPTVIMSGLFLSAFLVGQPAHAAKNDLGTDVSKFQPQLTNNSGNDKFSIAQVGGSVHGWTYEQAPYSNQIYQGQAMNYHMHNYIWLETGANQTQTKAALDHFLSEIKTPYGSIVAIDYEAGATGDKEANTANAIYAMQLVKQAGFTPMLYSYKPYLKAHINVDEVLKEFPNSLWIAGYQRSGNQPDYNCFPSMNGVAMWQFDDSPRDLDVDLTGITDNGYTKNTNVTPSDQPIAEPQPVKNDEPKQSTWKPETYTVETDDTLTAVSEKTGDSVATIVANNGISNPNAIYVGQKLLVNHIKFQQAIGLNQKVRYVQPGDTLTRLSYLIGDRWQTIVANNPDVFTNGYYSTIYQGQPIYFYR